MWGLGRKTKPEMRVITPAGRLRPNSAAAFLQLFSETPVEQKDRAVVEFFIDVGGDIESELRIAASAVIPYLGEKPRLPGENPPDAGILCNLRNFGLFEGEDSEICLKRALFVSEVFPTSGFIVEFFIAFCLHSVRISSPKLGLAYAAQIARQRPSGRLTREEYCIFRDALLSIGGSYVFEAFRAHAAAYGDTEVIFKI